MYTVYVLRDENGKIYKGMTSNLARRLAEHLSGKTRTTRGMVSPEIVYTEVLPDRIQARVREKYLKSSAGRRFLQKILNESS